MGNNIRFYRSRGLIGPSPTQIRPANVWLRCILLTCNYYDEI